MKILSINFLEKGEKPTRLQNGYNRSILPFPYALVSHHVMHYFTLEESYTIVHGYHFPILSHIRHKEFINIPYYLFYSLYINSEKDVSPPLHQGLIFALYKHVFSLSPHNSKMLTYNENLDNPSISIKIEVIETEPHTLEKPKASSKKIGKNTKISSNDVLKITLLKATIDE